MRIRYFAGAAAAAGTDEETVPLDALAGAATLAGLVGHLSAREDGAADHGPGAGAGAAVAVRRSAPPLRVVLARSSFLVNAVAERDPRRRLVDTDTVDVLPPFAGG